MSSPGLIAVVALGGGVGSALRYLVDNAVPSGLRARYPWGTTLVNLTGSFALGLLVGAPGPAADWRTVVGVGLIGGYTTFSTASLETVTLFEERRYGAGMANGLGMLLACTGAAILGLAITS